MLRHRLAFPALLATRVVRSIGQPGKEFRILLFHDIAEESIENFERLITYIKEVHGVLTPEQAAAWISNPQQPAPSRSGASPCVLSFDDGFASNHEVAVSVLARHDLRALFFVCPGLVDLGRPQQRDAIASNIFDGRRREEDLDPALRLMSWDEIVDLRERGHSIGCHGLLHRRLSRLDHRELEQEVLEGADMLETRLDAASPWYAYAFGDIDSVSSEAMDMIGKRFAFCRSGIRGANSNRTHRLSVLADEIDITAPPAYWKLVAEGGLDVRYRSPRRRLTKLTASDEQ